jgi:hypothetical protein
VNFTGSTNGTQHSSEALSYQVVYDSNNVLKVNFTEKVVSNGTANTFSALSWVNKNGTVLATEYFGQNFTGSQAKTFFDAEMVVFTIYLTYHSLLSVYTDPANFHAVGTSSKMFGPTTIQVTTYMANHLPELIDTPCSNSSFNLTDFSLDLGTPPGSATQFMTFLHLAGTYMQPGHGPQQEDYTFRLVSMTVA